MDRRLITATTRKSLSIIRIEPTETNPSMSDEPSDKDESIKLIRLTIKNPNPTQSEI